MHDDACLGAHGTAPAVRAGLHPLAREAAEPTGNQRDPVEGCVHRLKQWRGLAMRTNKLAIAYEGALRLARILIWTRLREVKDAYSPGNP